MLVAALALLGAPVIAGLEFGGGGSANDPFRKLVDLRSAEFGGEASQAFSLDGLAVGGAAPVRAVLEGVSVPVFVAPGATSAHALRADALGVWTLLEADGARLEALGGVRVGAEFAGDAEAAGDDGTLTAHAIAPHAGVRAAVPLVGGATLAMRAGVTGDGAGPVSLRGMAATASLEVPVDAHWTASLNAGWRERDGWWDSPERGGSDQGAVWFGFSASF